jgi:6-pyruvoyltetrahydropterin/6-carboxytetrahydropterin synthase
MYYSTKKFGAISTGHRQFRAAELRDSSRCAWAHGYGRHVEFTFGASELDARGWVVDFGGLRFVKAFLDEQWDHRLLLSSEDPLLPQFLELQELGGCNINVMDASKGWGPGIEQSCRFVYDHIAPRIFSDSAGRCSVTKVQIWEHDNNSAIFVPDDL